MEKTEKFITPLQESFCVLYATPGGETFNKKEASAILAGYSEASARNSATELLAKPEIQKRILQIETDFRAQITSRILLDTENAKLKAEAEKDWANYLRACEDQMRILGIYREGVFEPQANPEIQKRTEQEKAAMRRIIGVRLQEMAKES